MKSKELFERGCIDVEDDITFRTHADVLRLFGREHKVFQLAFAKHPQEDGVHIWFPKFYQDGCLSTQTATKEFCSQRLSTALVMKCINSKASTTSITS